MSKTNYQKVVQFNRVFGVPVSEQPRHNIFDEDPKLVELRMNLIREEVGELEDAVKDKDMKETFDALSDILYVVYGMGASLGLDLDRGMDLVHESNMSKSCTSEKEAESTVQWYLEKFATGEQPYDSPAYRKSDDGNYWVVYNSSTGKILKSINYSPVDFTDILGQLEEE
jgi:predicted HAD superfamily Cof-like phosphohydrolase